MNAELLPSCGTVHVAGKECPICGPLARCVAMGRGRRTEHFDRKRATGTKVAKVKPVVPVEQELWMPYKD